MMKFALLLILLWSLVEVHSQTPPAPYLTFMGESLPDHSYVDLSALGELDNEDDHVVCHTDLTSCCGGGGIDDRGYWFFPNGAELPGAGSAGGTTNPIVLWRDIQLVSLIRGTGPGDAPSGLYRCIIETNADNGPGSPSPGNGIGETVYVGVYSTGGDITIPDGMTLTVDSYLNGASPQFTLTCISTGGPATTVTWTRDSATVTVGTVTVFNDAETATYTHILTVTGRLGGDYQCTVSNVKPPSASASLRIEVASAPSNLMAVQEGPTSVRVSWSLPTPLEDTPGYRISYNGGSSGSVDVSGGSTSTHTLTGLVNGAIYTISIMGISLHLPSDAIQVMNIGLVPGQPSVTVASTTSRTISLSWSVPSGSVVTSYVVIWRRDTSVCPGDDEDSMSVITTDVSTSHTITVQQEDSDYIITVAAINVAGTSALSNAVTAMTREAAPSAAPTSVSVSGVTSSSITVQWGAVDCIHHNGDITGYSVRYGVQGSGSTQTVSVSGGGATMTTISGLTPSTTYSIEVAAVNSAGTGVYSTPSTVVETDVASAPSNLMAVQEGLTSIRVSWSPPSPLGDTTGYRISYSGGSSGSVDVSDGSTDNYTLTGLVNGAGYTISIVATSLHLPSGSMEAMITLIPAPGQPSIREVSTTATTISLSWSVPSESVVTSYEVMWQRSSSAAGSSGPSTRAEDGVGTSGEITDGSTSYTIVGLESGTFYSITVRVSNPVGSADSSLVNISTSREAVCEACQTDTGAIVGGVVAVVILSIVTALTVIVVVALLKNRFGNYSTGAQRKRSDSAVDIPASSNAAYELTKITEATYEEPAIHISSNEAYHVVSQTGGVVTTHTPTSHPSQPAQPATADALYEAIES